MRNLVLGKDHVLGDLAADALELDARAGLAVIGTRLGVAGAFLRRTAGRGLDVAGEIVDQDSAVRSAAADLREIDAELAGHLPHRRGRPHGLRRRGNTRRRRFGGLVLLDRFLFFAVRFGLLSCAFSWLRFFAIRRSRFLVLRRLHVAFGFSARVSQNHLAHLDLPAGLCSQLRDRAGERRRHFHGGLIGQHLHEVLAALDGVARLDEPIDEFGFVDAFAEFGELEFHLGLPPLVSWPYCDCKRSEWTRQPETSAVA